MKDRTPANCKILHEFLGILTMTHCWKRVGRYGHKGHVIFRRLRLEKKTRDLFCGPVSWELASTPVACKTKILSRNNIPYWRSDMQYPYWRSETTIDLSHNGRNHYM